MSWGLWRSKADNLHLDHLAHLDHLDHLVAAAALLLEDLFCFINFLIKLKLLFSLNPTMLGWYHLGFQPLDILEETVGIMIGIMKRQ